MAIPNQAEFYAVYPPGGHPGMVDASAFYYDPKGVVGQSTGESDIISSGIGDQISLPSVSLFFHSPLTSFLPESDRLPRPAS